jgi:thiamine transport system ATP-binding protein
VVGLGPGALQVVTGEGWAGGHDLEVPVAASRFVRGRTEVDVELPGGLRASAVAAGAAEVGALVQVRLDPDGAVVVSAGAGPAASERG